MRSQYDRLPAWQGGYTDGFRNMWAPGRLSQFDEDPVFMLKPQFHAELVMPSHCQVIRYIEYPYIHIHSSQIQTLDRLLEIEELPAVEFTPDHGYPVSEMIPVIAKIQARKPVIVHGYLTAEEIKMIVDRVPPEGLWLIGRANTPEEAHRLQDTVLG